MNKKVLSVIFLLLALSTSLLLFGCKVEKIQFNRESQVSKLINKVSDTKPKTNSKSGIIILKDDNESQNTINFGPKDINFDMPIRFK